MRGEPHVGYRLRFAAVAGAVALMAAWLGVAAHAQQRREKPLPPRPPGMTELQLIRILNLGPWPPSGPWPRAWAPDPTNRVSGTPEAIDLGRRLFVDARLSPQGTHACSSCHRPESAWQDSHPTARGLGISKRNTPSLVDVRYQKWLGWDGAGDSLWAQSIRPILDPTEMGSTAEHVRAHITAHGELASLYEQLFKRPPGDTSAQDVLVDAAKALAAYQETLVSPTTPFDAFRDRLAAGLVDAEDPYPAAARRGLQLFVGEAMCARCHMGPLLRHGGFERLHKRPSARLVERDAGRYGGVTKMLASPYNLRSRFNDSSGRLVFWSSRGGGSAIVERNRGSFRVPGLRGVANTAPYMHDGSVATLAEAVAHPVPATQAWKSYRRPLTPTEIQDLVAFLETLSAP